MANGTRPFPSLFTGQGVVEGAPNPAAGSADNVQEALGCWSFDPEKVLNSKWDRKKYGGFQNMEDKKRNIYGL